MAQSLTRRERRQLAREQKRRAQRSAPGVSSAVPAWYWAIPCLVAFLAYVRTVSFDFIHNDYAEISLIGGFWHEIARPTHHYAMYYRPAYSAFMFLIHALVSVRDPRGWHFASVVLHALATYVVFRFIRALVIDPAVAGFAAFLFAIHPIHIEAVSWILANNEMLYTISFLASALFLVAFFRSKRRVYFVLSIAAWFVALCSKETATALLPIFPVIVYVETRDIKRALKVAVPYFCGIVAFLSLRASVLRSGMFNAGLSYYAPRAWKLVLCAAPEVALSYLRKLAWPSGLDWFYPVSLFPKPTPRMWVAFAVVIAMILLCAWLARRDLRIAVAGLLIVLPLIPVLYGMRFFQAPELIADRYLYLPSVGSCLLVALLAKHAALWPRGSKRVLQVGACVTALSYALLLFSQSGIYTDSEHLDLRVLDLQPANVDVMRTLGRLYFIDGQMTQSAAMNRRILQLRPGDAAAESNLAYVEKLNGTPMAAQRAMQHSANWMGQLNSAARQAKFEARWSETQ